MHVCFCCVRFSYSVLSQEIVAGKNVSEIAANVHMCHAMLSFHLNNIYRRIWWLLFSLSALLSTTTLTVVNNGLWQRNLYLISGRSVCQFVWPGAWLRAGGWTGGQTGGRPSHSRAVVCFIRQQFMLTIKCNRCPKLTDYWPQQLASRQSSWGLTALATFFFLWHWYSKLAEIALRWSDMLSVSIIAHVCIQTHTPDRLLRLDQWIDSLKASRVTGWCRCYTTVSPAESCRRRYSSVRRTTSVWSTWLMTRSILELEVLSRSWTDSQWRAAPGVCSYRRWGGNTRHR